MIKTKNYIPRTVTKFTSPVTGNRAVKATRQFGVDADGKLLNTVPQRFPAGNIDPNLPSAPAHKTGMDFNRSGEGTTAFTARAQMKVARDVSTPRRVVSADDYPVKRSAESERMRKASAEHDAAIEADKNLTPAGTMSAAQKIAAMRTSTQPAPAPLTVHHTVNTPVKQSWEKEHSAFYKKAGAVTVTKPTMEQAVFNFLSKKQFGVNEAKSKIGEYTHGPVTARIYKLSGQEKWTEGNPYKVQLHVNGKHHEPADYWTDDEDDAHGTAKMMAKRHKVDEQAPTSAAKPVVVPTKTTNVTKPKPRETIQNSDYKARMRARKNPITTHEEVEVDEVVTLNDSFDFGLDLNESYDFGSYLSAAKTIYDEDEAIKAANESYKAQDTEIFFEAFAAEQMEIIIAEEEALGNEVSDAKYSIDGNNAQIEYVVTEAAGMRKKYVHKGAC